MSERAKLFCGIALDDRIRAQCSLVARRLNASGLHAKYESPDKYHITLAFLGWVQRDRIGELSAAMTAAAANRRPFQLTIDKIGAFPNERNPHVVWLGARDQGSPLRSLSAAVRTEYETLGFAFDKPAVAHVTLARVKARGEHLPLLEVPDIAVHVGAVTLFESVAAGGTTRYLVREVTALGA